MNTKRPQLSPLELIEERPGRRSRAESILRLLLSTSYPHASFSNLVIALVKGYGLTEREELEHLAADLREQERDLNLFDFIRCLELQREASQLTIVAKRLLMDEPIRVVRDTVKHHEPFLNACLELEPDSVLLTAEDLARDLVGAFYKTQVVGPEKNRDLHTTMWMHRHKERTGDPEHPSERGGSLVYHDRMVSFEDTVAILAKSLSKTEFHVILTQNTILLLDQSSRLWFVPSE